jgi:hypothetical protein
MLDLPVLMSVLGVRWHREHLASSGVENISSDVRELEALDELELLDELDDEVIESSLVTCNRFCCGTGAGLIGDSWAAAVCILKKSLFETLLVVAWGGRYASNG